MRGVNVVTISGNVGSFEFGQTRSNQDETCSFVLAVEKKRGDVTWVRVNVYGEGRVGACREHLKKGLYVIVEGELMERVNKHKDNKVMEVRCKEIKFIHSGRERQPGDEDEPGDDWKAEMDKDFAGNQ